MARYFFFLGMLLILTRLSFGQAIKHPDLSDYNDAKKRTLVISTGKFIYVNSQGQIDQDSAIQLSCRIYGLGRLFPYDEDFQGSVFAKYISLIDAGDITKVRAELNTLRDKVPVLLLLGSWYLFKAGSEKTDLDKAENYITDAVRLSRKAGYERETDLLAAKYFMKTGNIKEGRKYFSLAETYDLKTGSQLNLANDYLANGDYLPFNQPEKILFLEKAMKLFQKLDAKEKQIEAMTYIIGVHFLYDWDLTEKELFQLLALQQKSGFRHIQFTYCVLAYLYTSKKENFKSLSFAQKCLKTMQETGDDFLIPIPYQQIGEVYNELDQHEEALKYYQKGYASKDRNTMIFWDRCFANAATALAFTNRENEALSLIREITTACPPVTLFDKALVAYLKGTCYDDLHDTTLAEKYYDE